MKLSKHFYIQDTDKQLSSPMINNQSRTVPIHMANFKKHDGPDNSLKNKSEIIDLKARGKISKHF